MWRNVWVVVRREYLQRVRSRWFIFGTVGGPLLMTGLFIVPGYFAARSERGERELAVVDATGVLYDRLAPDLEEGGWSVRRVEWSSGVIDALEERTEVGEIAGFVVLDSATLSSGEATLYTLSPPSTVRRLTLRSSVARAALAHNLEGRGVDADALLRGGGLRVEVLSEAGSNANDSRFAVAYVGAFFLYMVILIYAVAVMRATLEEKTSRIVEIVISSMEPWQLMLGKIIGVAGVSFTQMGVWLGSGTLLATLGLPAVISARPDLPQLVDLSDVLSQASLLGLFAGFFVLGFFMYSGLYAAVGAMCNTHDEAQQAQLPVVMLLVVPIVLVMPVIENPMTPMATGMSLFPLFTPILMWARVVSGGVPAWQIALSFALMVAATLAIAWLAGRIYKTGILMSGKRPTLPELWRWVREA